MSKEYVYVIFTLIGPIKLEEMLAFSHGGMLKLKYKGPTSTIKKAYEKVLDWKSKQWDHALVPLLQVQKTKVVTK